MTGRRRCAVAFVCLAAIVAATSSITTPAVAADDKVEWVGAFEQGQKLRDEGKLRAAREALVICQRDVCPAPVRKDCVDLGAEVQRLSPTMLLTLHDDRGQDVIDARVTIDGEPVNLASVG